MKVYFVGAGPGDPELLTLKAERLLRTCRVCIYAGSLVSPEVVALLTPDAETHDSSALTHREVMDIMTDATKRGMDVVRLHTGDPTIYSAIGEQIRELDAMGIDCEVVPGVSSFQSAAASLKWELTVPEVVQSIVLSRTPGRTPMPEKESLKRYAETGATLCLFLSARSLDRDVRVLAAHYGNDCPAAVVYHASWPDELIITGTLSDIAKRVEEAGISRTAMFIVRPKDKGAMSRLYAPGFSHGYRAREA